MSDTTAIDAASEPSARVAAILEAACRVIARDGAHGLHMNAVAQEAGVSKALVHYYVQTRQELLRQAMSFAEQRTREAVEAELAPLPNGRARLERLLVAYAGNEPVFAESHALSSAAWGSLILDEDLAPVVRAAYHGWAAWIQSLVEQGHDDGSIPVAQTARTIAVRLAALADGLSSLVDTGVIPADEAVAAIRHEVAGLVGT
jgi:AcrR family transcriptional regulator